MNTGGKRLIDILDGDSSSKKKKLVLHPDLRATISAPQTPNTHHQDYDFIIHPEDKFDGTFNVFFKNEVISNLNVKLTERKSSYFEYELQPFPPVERHPHMREDYRRILNRLKPFATQCREAEEA